MITEPKQYQNDDRTTTLSQWKQKQNSITILTEPQQYHNDNRTTTVSQR